MFDDLRSIEHDSVIAADLCVVGAGAAGIALAREFLHSSLQVVLIESGGINDTSADDLNEGENVGARPINMAAGRRRAFGGATRLWAGQCIPLEASDFEPRPWVPHSGWPIRLGDLTPFYARAASLFHVPADRLNEDIYRLFHLRPPEVDASKLEHVATAFAPQMNLGKIFRRGFGRAANVRVLLGGTVTRFVTNDARSSIRHAEVSCRDGRRFRVAARAFVMCGGGIENARALLLSEQLGNTHDLVGRFLQDHPNGRAAEVATGAPRRLQDLYGLLHRPPLRFYPKLRLTEPLQHRLQVLGCAVMINSDFGTDGLDAARQLYRAVRSRRLPAAPGSTAWRMATDARQIVSTLYRRYRLGLSATSPASRLWLQTYAEQAPNPDSRITLSDQRDALGMRVARVDWRLTELDRLTAAAAVRTVADEFSRLGLAAVQPAEWVCDVSERWADGVHDAYHHIGTTRMADHPRHGVVDRHCQVHGVAGLYVAGSSVFPTGGYANPTLTIVALAIRLADRLRETALSAPCPTTIGA